MALDDLAKRTTRKFHHHDTSSPQKQQKEHYFRSECNLRASGPSEHQCPKWLFCSPWEKLVIVEVSKHGAYIQCAHPLFVLFAKDQVTKFLPTCMARGERSAKTFHQWLTLPPDAMRNNTSFSQCPSVRPSVIHVYCVSNSKRLKMSTNFFSSRSPRPHHSFCAQVPLHNSTVMWSETVDLRTRPVWDQKKSVLILVLVLHTAVLVLFCETRS